MADIKISELTQVSALNNGDLVEVSQVNALAPSGYTSLKASMTDLGKKVNADIEYTTELSDFADKTPLGAIKETAKDKNVADEYDGTQTYDKGDVVIYKNTLYICTTNNTTGTWDATKWTATTIDNIIGSLSQLTTTDKSSLVGAVNEVARYTPVYGNTASGAIATFDTSLALPLQDCTIEINAVQSGSGTPSPDNVRPITGFSSVNVSRTGKNLLPMPITSGSYSNQVTITVNDDKSFYISKPSGSGWTSFPLATMMLKKGTYTLIEDDDSSYNSTIDVRLAGTTTPLVDTRYTKRRVFPVVKDTKVDIIYSRVSSADNVLTKLMLFVGDTATATDYEPYNGTPVTISLGQTVYGGSLDVTSGKLTVTHKHITFDFTSSSDIGGGYSRKTYALGDDEAVYPPSESNSQICNVAPYKASFAEQSTHFYCSNTHCNVILPSDTPTSTTIEVVYELLTPKTYQLTPTQISAIVGTNNVFTDTNGDTSVVYACSLKDYIDRQ